jgi:RNA-splicing ligase RtcB
MVLPQAVGNDVNCGMRLETTELEADQVRGALDVLQTRLRRTSSRAAGGSRSIRPSARRCCATGCPACSRAARTCP